MVPTGHSRDVRKLQRELLGVLITKRCPDFRCVWCPDYVGPSDTYGVSWLAGVDLISQSLWSGHTSLWSGHLFVIRTPLRDQDTCLWSGHLFMIRTPLCDQDTSSWSGHLFVIRTLLHDQDTSLWSGHLFMIRTPLCDQDTSLWSGHHYPNSQRLHCTTAKPAREPSHQDTPSHPTPLHPQIPEKVSWNHQKSDHLASSHQSTKHSSHETPPSDQSYALKAREGVNCFSKALPPV